MPSKAERVVLEVAGREVTVTNPRKVYFPEAGITKLEVVQYYLSVAEGARAALTEAVRKTAEKRIVLKFKPREYVSWDHSRLGGRY